MYIIPADLIKGPSELQQLHLDLCGDLDRIRARFKEPDDVRVTLVVRHSTKPRREVVLTDESAEGMDLAILEIKRHQREFPNGR